MNPETIAQAVYQHAVDNYADGWDTLVECYSLDEIVEELTEEGCQTVSEAIAYFKQSLADYNAYRDDIRATAY